MKKETFKPFLTNKIHKEVKPSAGCCGGAPSINADACCKLDEDKKAERKEGCGCNTTNDKKPETSCC